jgi:hypothetical protein
MPKKIRTAVGLDQVKCDCGCGQIYVYLTGDDGEAFARFCLQRDQWIPFAEDCVRQCDGEEPLGPDGERLPLQ